MRLITTAAVAALVAVAPDARADDVTEALQNALAAYEEGDIAYAMEELTFAQQLMVAMKAEALAAFLPEAPAGWTRTVSSQGNAAMGMMGGGSNAEASYEREGEQFRITFTADSPMVAAMAGMFGNAAILSASGATLVRIGREKFADQDGDLTGVIDNRILIQATGAPAEAMIPVLEAIDFRELARFGS